MQAYERWIRMISMISFTLLYLVFGGFYLYISSFTWILANDLKFILIIEIGFLFIVIALSFFLLIKNFGSLSVFRSTFDAVNVITLVFFLVFYFKIYIRDGYLIRVNLIDGVYLCILGIIALTITGIEIYNWVTKYFEEHFYELMIKVEIEERNTK